MAIVIASSTVTLLPLKRPKNLSVALLLLQRRNNLYYKFFFIGFIATVSKAVKNIPVTSLPLSNGK